LCKTKPIWGVQQGLESMVRNKANSSIADFGLGIGDRPAAGRPLRAAGPGAGCTNKANCPKGGTEAVSGGATERASALRERVYGE
jgi:hypothetical protein